MTPRLRDLLRVWRRSFRWIVVPLLALFAACGAEDGQPPKPGGSAGRAAGSGPESGAAGTGRAGRAGTAGESTGGAEAGAPGSGAPGSGSGGDPAGGQGEGAEAGSGGSNAGRGGSGASGSGGADSGDAGSGGDEPMSSPAASITIAGSDFALALGASVTLNAEARDAQGNVVSAPIAWRSSDTSVASVSAGRVTGTALGHAEITASADGVVSTPVVVWVNPAQTTGQALREAVAAGTLTEDEALVYRVFALFRDSRLPGEFWSTEAEDRHGDHQILFEVAQRFDSLPEALQEAVGPYLVPPAYAPASGSSSPSPKWSGDRVLARERPSFCSGVIDSGWLSEPTEHFRVWYLPQFPNDTFEAEWARTVGGHAEAAYQTLVTEQGFRPPVPDSGLCNGGDEKLDIYLATQSLGAYGLTTPTGNPAEDGTSSAYIHISPTVPVNEIRGTVAHEFMHVLQAAYQNLYTPSYQWTRDATATWAESVMDPGSSSYLDYGRSFLKRVHQPLFFPNHYCDSAEAGPECAEDPSASQKIYGSYLFFQFLEHRVGVGTVKSFFEAAEFDRESLNELSFVLAGQGGLTGIWGEFVRTLWNQDPIPAASSFRGWDGQAANLASRTGSDEVQTLTPAQSAASVPRVPSILAIDGSRLRNQPLNELSATYDHYRFGPGVRSVTFYNGFALKMGKTPFGVISGSGKTLDAGEQFMIYDTTAEEVKGREVWALKKIDGVWSAEDWSTLAFGVQCLDKASERLEELVLIFSNGNFTTARGSDFEANAAGPRGSERAAVVASSVPCWKYKGNYVAHLAYQSGGDTFDVTNTLDATFVGEPHLGRASTASGLGYVFLGWQFVTDVADTTMSSSFLGTMGSCNESVVRDGFVEYSGTQLGDGYSFESYLPIPGGVGQNRYSGRSSSFQWILEGCAGADKKMPAPAVLDFDLKFESLLGIEPVGATDMRLRGTELPGPPVDLGNYASSPDVVNNWCFEALREGDPEPTVCD